MRGRDDPGIDLALLAFVVAAVALVIWRAVLDLWDVG